ncbi:hypothetical protein K439DRAFT_1563976 [Ramaria rubella]|nr:hypothetical protein K439DRAFT_1563976 [Ramaria rubella]
MTPEAFRFSNGFEDFETSIKTTVEIAIVISPNGSAFAAKLLVTLTVEGKNDICLYIAGHAETYSNLSGYMSLAHPFLGASPAHFYLSICLVLPLMVSIITGIFTHLYPLDIPTIAITVSSAHTPSFIFCIALTASSEVSCGLNDITSMLPSIIWRPPISYAEAVRSQEWSRVVVGAGEHELLAQSG